MNSNSKLCVLAEFPARRPKNQIGQWHLPENGRSHTFPCAWIISATESIGLSFFSIFCRLQTCKKTSILDWISVANSFERLFHWLSLFDFFLQWRAAVIVLFLLLERSRWFYLFIFLLLLFFYRFVYYCCCCLLYFELFIMSYFFLLFNSVLLLCFLLGRSTLLYLLLWMCAVMRSRTHIYRIQN